MKFREVSVKNNRLIINDKRFDPIILTIDTFVTNGCNNIGRHYKQRPRSLAAVNNNNQIGLRKASKEITFNELAEFNLIKRKNKEINSHFL